MKKQQEISDMPLPVNKFPVLLHVAISMTRSIFVYMKNYCVIIFKEKKNFCFRNVQFLWCS